MIGFVFYIIVGAFTENLTEKTFSDDQYYQSEEWPKLVAFLVTGVIIWFLGQYLDHRGMKKLVDSQTNEEVVIKKTNSLLLIPMKYWGLIFFALGISFSFANSPKIEGSKVNLTNNETPAIEQPSSDSEKLQLPTPEPLEDLYYGGFNGTWVGRLQSITPDSSDYPSVLNAVNGKWGLEIKIVVDNQDVKVFRRPSQDWNEAKAGEFTISTHKTNAVIFATNSSEDIYDETGYGGWVETWNITLSHKRRKYFICLLGKGSKQLSRTL